MKTIWWIRRDLRLEDNYALSEASKNGAKVIPVFILDPKFSNDFFTRRSGFLFQALRSLDTDLKNIGSGLVVRSGEPVTELSRLIQETRAVRIFAEREYTPFALERDARVAEHLPLALTRGQLVFSPSDLLKADGKPYTIFTPFAKKWRSMLPKKMALLPAPVRLPKVSLPASVKLPSQPNKCEFLASEYEARKRLLEFTVEDIYHYHNERNDLAAENTSKLSPYFRFGLISNRKVVDTAIRALSDIWLQAENFPSGVLDQGPNIWLNELIWREFYVNILYNFPNVRNSAFDERFDQIQWREAFLDLEAWKNGMTGVPIVDAGMRQLKKTGWMHNRARMITASYLVKDLLIDWREGERWFASQLVDADPAANNGGWQWVAGTGTDAAPYFRIFNPVLQGVKFDPGGKYVRRWVPALKNVPDKFIHKPWMMSETDQLQAGIALGKDYPFPLVDHKFARERALSAYKAARNGS